MAFDARAKSTKGGLSINDVLEKGPLLTPFMYRVLIRFRCKNIVINADIEKAFLQIGIHVDDKDLLRFLWLRNIEKIDFDEMINNEIIEYRCCRVLFGLKPSPHLVSAVLRMHIMSYYCENSDLIEKIFNSLHVDDLLTSEGTDDEALKFYSSVKSCLAADNFNLRKFSSNSKKLENLVYSMYPQDKVYSTEGKQKLFALCWNKDTDELMYDELRLSVTEVPTRRQLLKYFATLIDPLGLICPVTVEMKLLFQDVCRAKLKWDECLTPEFQK